VSEPTAVLSLATEPVYRATGSGPNPRADDRGAARTDGTARRGAYVIVNRPSALKQELPLMFTQTLYVPRGWYAYRHV
jgi:hypothetical protein